jgi:nicotinamide phosphoribosyltransferase
MTPIIYTDYYKTEHFKMYPDGTSMIYSNLTPRKSRMKGIDSIVVFGIQHFIKKYLLGKFKTEFFDKPWEQVEEEYKFAINTSTDHVKKLHDLKYLPLEIKALPEGSRCPIGVPCMTIRNTLPEFYWLTNYLETLISCSLWQPMTSATIAAEYYKLLSKYAIETTGSADFVQWQAHDFSMRGMSSLESAILSGMAHLTSFTGTDTIPAIYALRNSYKAEGLIGASVPATEHSVMCMGTKDDEIGTFSRLLDLYPTGILSVVSDTWDLWKVVGPGGYCEQLKEKILARDGKLVIRPDSGDPVDIICGVPMTSASLNDDNTWSHSYKNGYKEGSVQQKGVIELLWDIFGGKINKYGYKELDPHVGAIYGDSITLERAEQICERLKRKGFASTNIVFGVGSYTYQYNTRDTFGFAMKATYGEVTRIAEEDMFDQGGPSLGEKWIETREIYKDPITDDGTKKSAKGLLRVEYDSYQDKFLLIDQCKWEGEAETLLLPVFIDGKLVREYTLEEIRKRIKE